MVYDWTGFYLGVNAGVGLGRNNTSLAVPDFPSFEQSYLSPQGALGGAQAGYNWQTNSHLGPLVFGVEADIQGTGIRDDYTCLLGCLTGAESPRTISGSTGSARCVAGSASPTVR